MEEAASEAQAEGSANCRCGDVFLCPRPWYCNVPVVFEFLNGFTRVSWCSFEGLSVVSWLVMVLVALVVGVA